ncbi:hypothetical protein P170DRAFT_464581 [Aspergillus steynii IBT 23096]|uniref:Zn(2)-C6 fungal-type domain-containing protein n=1 Tax=Aspergillus steynii IBT 23096 TaxID=1392250 RepID=A0A2I2G817_9EURO|nr:uncharacterized protein P170DRAFT_464581 [Aspergillus steynii IBT 23096]PLB49026.1 hypothetical protein P170DRAFT_464581 [Aspergillus steynii IBT 23096]
MADDDRRKRRRLAKSCEQCRQRKVRCDRNAPCGPCTRARASLSCSYRNKASTTTSSFPLDVIPPASHPDRLHHKGPGNHPTPASNDETEPRSTWDSVQGPGSPGQVDPSIGSLQHRLRRVEELLSHRGNNLTPGRDGSLDQALRELSTRVQGVEQQLSEGSSSGKTQTADKGELCINAANPRLHASSTLVAQIKECRGIRQSVKARQSFQPTEPVPDLKASIPVRPICDELVDGYLRTFEPIYRILHLPSFWREYHHFWAQDHLPPSKAFLMKLVLILAIGTVFHPKRGKSGPDHNVQLTQTWIHAAQWWLTGPSEKSTLGLDGIQVFCLLIIARQISAMGSSPWLSVGSLMQRAMTMGLHLDSTHFPALSVFQSEMRARLWATILQLAVQASMDSAGHPLLIPEFDTQPPANYNDVDFDPDIHVQSSRSARPAAEVTDTSIQRLMHQTFDLRAKVIRALNNRPSLSYTHAIQLGTELQTACRSITEFFQNSSEDISPNTSRHLSPNSFHKSFLDLVLRRWLLALHTPFMLQSSSNPEFYFSRKTCLETAMTIASYARPLNLPSVPDDDLCRLMIAGRSSMKGALSLDIISILGLEVTRQIEESPMEDAGIMSELALLSRAPILNVMKHILSQLLRVISLGTPSLKRYNLLAAIMGQIGAMDTGDCVERVVYETVRESLGESVALLQSGSSRGMALGEGSQRAESLLDPGIAELGLDLHPELAFDSDSDFNLDIASVLGLSDWMNLEMNIPESHF